MSDQQEVWTAVAQLLRAQLTESVWYSTFAEVQPIVGDDHTELVIQVPSTLARDRILTRYQPLITDAAERTAAVASYSGVPAAAREEIIERHGVDWIVPPTGEVTRPGSGAAPR